MSTTKGSCLCGQVKFEIEGKLEKFFLCHCSRCRKNTGSVHCANIFSSSAKLNWLTGEEQVKIFNLPETHFCNSFCKGCGTRVPTQYPNGTILVPAGALDDDISVKPNAHIFLDSRANWEDCLIEAPKFQQLPK